MTSKYSLFNRDNLKHPIQMQLSQKKNLFPQFLCKVLKSTSNSQHFQKKDDPHSSCITEIMDAEKDN